MEASKTKRRLTVTRFELARETHHGFGAGPKRDAVTTWLHCRARKPSARPCSLINQLATGYLASSRDNTSVAMHQTHSRPLGPRNIPRSQSPLLPETRPLQIRKASVDQSSLRPPSPASQLSSSPIPSRPLIPGASPTPRANGLRPKLHLPLSGSVGSISSYYPGPASIPPGLDGENPGGATVRPSDVQLQTARPPEQNDNSDNSIEQLVSVFEKASVDSYTSAEESSTYGSTKWSDNVLEVISRLGEGQGGAVHKVRDLRNGFILARKTITTREAPLKQLERELQISSSSKHINIIQFYGAYMSPSSSEVKVMMEFGAGGSLEAVGKRIKERGGRVSERVAGRIAEGVILGRCHFTMDLIFVLS